jgi:polyhydroxybutyrate depolymerase
MRARALIFGTSIVASLLACGSDGASVATSSAPNNPGPAPINVGSSSGVAPSTSTGGGAAATATGTVTPPAVPDVVVTTESASFGGATRTYFLAKPVDYDASKAYPLVVLLHGNPGSKEQMRAFAPFESVSHRAAVLAYPDASNGAWDLYTPTASNADMSWLLDLPKEIAATTNIDRSRVYGFGFSGGSFMLAQMSCRFGTSAYRAYAINSGGGPQEDQMGYSKRSDGCFVCPGGPVPALVVHGDADTEVVPASGAFTAACLGDTNGCSEFPKDPTTPSPCVTGPGCSKPVEWCLIPGMNHAVWDQAMPTAWSFFNAN